MSIESDHAKLMLTQIKATADSAMRAIEASEQLVDKPKDFFESYEEHLSFEHDIDDKMLECGLDWERNGYDSYDASIEFYGVEPEGRLNQKAHDYLSAMGFRRAWLNHKDNMETYYGFPIPSLNVEAKESRRPSAPHRQYKPTPKQYSSDIRGLDEETIIHFLTCHPKYLHNPLSDDERALIRDIVRVLCPLTRLKPMSELEEQGRRG